MTYARDTHRLLSKLIIQTYFIPHKQTKRKLDNDNMTSQCDAKPTRTPTEKSETVHPANPNPL